MIWNEVDMTSWTQPERHCLLSALQIVEQIERETYDNSISRSSRIELF